MQAFMLTFTNMYRNKHAGIIIPFTKRNKKSEQLMLFLLIYYLLLSSMNKSVTLQFFLCQFIYSHTVVLTVFVPYIHHKNMPKHH